MYIHIIAISICKCHSYNVATVQNNDTILKQNNSNIGIIFKPGFTWVYLTYVRIIARY